MEGLHPDQVQRLLGVGVSAANLKNFQKALEALRLPRRPTKDRLKSDSVKLRKICRAGASVLGIWPPRPERDASQNGAAELVKGVLRDARNAFARTYVDLIFNRITDGYRRFIRAEELVYEVAELCPGLCPTRKEVESDSPFFLAEKEGVEIAQTDFLAHVFAQRTAGLFLIQSMLQPLRRSQELLEKFRVEGRLELGTAQVERHGPLGCIYFNNRRCLNAEDDTTVLPLEIAADLVLLDSKIEIGLLRGNPMNHPKYEGRRVFSSGLNLTHLYQGKLSLMFYVTRDLGFVNKLYRGLSGETFDSEGPEATLEKPWIAAMESFAIGGGCQILLVMDYVIAEEGSYFNLPARKEGIIPGVGPLRFSRFVGVRAAQHGVLFDHTFSVPSPEAGSIVNEVVPAGQMDEAIRQAVAKFSGAGVVSTGANRKALRVGQESLDQFRQYMALYCREQGNCHFSPGLIANLERNWKADTRKRD